MNLSRIRRAAPVTASVLAVLVLGLAACSDDDDDADTTTAASEAPSPESTEEAEVTDVTETTEDSDTTEDTDATDDTNDTNDTDVSEGTDGTEAASTGTTAGTAAEEDYVAAAAEAIGFADPEVSECLAQALVDGIGMDRIEASGLSPEEFTGAPSLADIDLAVEEADAADVQEAMVDCGELVDSYLETLDITEDEADCARAELTDELLAEWLVTRISELPGSAELDAAVEAVDACDAD